MDSLQCFLCSSDSLRYAFKIKNNPLYICNDCGMTFFHHLHGIKEEKLEINTISNDKYIKELKQKTAGLYFNDMEYYISKSRLKNDKRVFTIGLGISEILEEGENRGYTVSGIDVGGKKANMFFEYIKNHTKKTDERYDYDVCILYNILNQIQDPITLLAYVKNLLKRDGVLYVVVPSLDSEPAKILKGKWFEFKIKNFYYFNNKTIQALLIKAAYQNLFLFPTYKKIGIDEFVNNYPKLKIPYLSRYNPNFFGRKNYKITESGVCVACIPNKTKETKTKLSIIMPVYNEVKSFSIVIEQVLQKHLENIEKEIIIVESNSTDGSKEKVKEYENHPNITIIYEETPKGKGHAVRNGLNVATGDIVLIQDADLEYDVDDYDALIKPLVNFRNMFVLGSRHTGSWKMRNMVDNKMVAFVMNIGQMIFTWMINVTCGVRLKDPFTMYKVFRKECLYGLEFTADRFDFDWEIVIKFIRRNYIPIEIPVNYTSRSYSEGKKVKIFKDPILWIIALVKYRYFTKI